jgi:hypothetical protein
VYVQDDSSLRRSRRVLDEARELEVVAEPLLVPQEQGLSRQRLAVPAGQGGPVSLAAPDAVAPFVRGEAFLEATHAQQRHAAHRMRFRALRQARDRTVEQRQHLVDAAAVVRDGARRRDLGR